MRAFWLAALVAIVGGSLLSWFLRRRQSRLADPVRLAKLLVVHGVMVVAFGWIAIGAAREGGALFWSLAVLCALLAVAQLGLGVFVVCAWIATERGDDSST
jgi:peptidoglycan biosynthesis protein MviN/MurJ (putative lipid II flippase)